MSNIDKGILSRVDYLDKNFAKLYYLEDEYYDVVETSRFLEKVALGDTVYYDYDNNQNKVFRVYEKAERKQFGLSELYIIANIDEGSFYLIKNGENKIVKVGKHQSGFEVGQLVYLEENENGIFLVGDQKISPAFNVALQEFGGGNKIKDFNIRRVFANEFHSKGVCLSPVDDIDELIYEPNTKFEKNLNYGDIYYDIKIGKNQKYVLDAATTAEISNYYSALYADKFPIPKKATNEEVLEHTKNILNFYYNKRAELDKVSKKAENEKLPYNENEVLGEFYLDELEEDNNGEYYRAVNYNEEALNDEVKVYIKDLPNIPAREGDSVVMVKDDFGNVKFYFTNKYLGNSLSEKIEAEERRLAYLNKGGLWK